VKRGSNSAEHRQGYGLAPRAGFEPATIRLTVEILAAS
jgi:hypothetical protein